MSENSIQLLWANKKIIVNLEITLYSMPLFPRGREKEGNEK